MFGITCKVLTLEGLIKAKQAVARAKDLGLLPELEALLEIRKAEKNKKEEGLLAPMGYTAIPNRLRLSYPLD